MTVLQAAEHFAVHPSTIRRWIDRGRLPAYRLGEKRIGVRATDLAQLVSPRPARVEQGAGQRDEPKRPAVRPLTKEQRRRGLKALAELERLSAAIADRYGELTPESWELLNQARDDRSQNLMRAVGE